MYIQHTSFFPIKSKHLKMPKILNTMLCESTLQSTLQYMNLLGCVKLLNISKPALYPDLLKTHCTIWPKQPLTIFNIQQLISKHFQFRINIMKMYKAELKIFYEACFLGNMQAEKLLRTWTLHEAQILIYNLTF